MAKEHSGGIIIADGFRLDDPKPIDDRLVVETTSDLLDPSILPNIYDGILVSVTTDNNVYRWNGSNRTQIANWEKLFISSTNNDASLDTLTLGGDINSSNFGSGISILNQNSNQLAIGAGGSFDDIQIGNGKNIKLTGPITASIISASSIYSNLTSSADLFFTSSGVGPKNYRIDYAKVYSSSINNNGDTITHSNILLESGSLTITASGLKIEGDLTASGSVTLDGALSFNGFNFFESSTTVISGSTQFGSGSTGSNIPLTTHQFTGSIIITGSGIFPDTNGTIDLGSHSKKFSNLYATNTFFGGVHEINLETEGLDQMQEGTVLTLKNGTLHPCKKEADPLVMGIVSSNSNFPIVLGAEPVLVTGKIKEGDYIITSKIKGHGKGIDPKHIYTKQLFGKIIAQAIEKGNGRSHIIKAMIRKM